MPLLAANTTITPSSRQALYQTVYDSKATTLLSLEIPSHNISIQSFLDDWLFQIYVSFPYNMY